MTPKVGTQTRQLLYISDKEYLYKELTGQRCLYPPGTGRVPFAKGLYFLLSGGQGRVRVPLLLTLAVSQVILIQNTQHARVTHQVAFPEPHP